MPKTSTSNVVTEQRRALARLRARHGWSRQEWINAAQDTVGRALLQFCQACHFRKHGRRRIAREMMADVERILARGVINLVVHPVKRNFDRVAAFDVAMSEMHGGTYAAMRRYVDRTFLVPRGGKSKRVTDRDIAAFEALLGFHARVIGDDVV